MLLSTRAEDDPETTPIELDRKRRWRRKVDAVREEIPAVKHESERQVTEGEGVRLAVVIQMPAEVSPKRTSMDTDEDEPGWRPGMELGVWEGRLGR